MHTQCRSGRWSRRLLRAGTLIVGVALLLGESTTAWSANSSFNPTILVNTESFQIIDEGDNLSTTNIYIQFGQTLNQRITYDRTNNRFDLTNGLFIHGGLTATGSITVRQNITATGGLIRAKNFSGSTLQIDNNASIYGNLTASGSMRANSNITAKGTLSGASLYVGGHANVGGNLVATGSIHAKSNITASGSLSIGGNTLTINRYNNTTDDTITFGNNTASQTLKYLNTAQKFKFSKDVSVNGNMSGSTLTVDGDVTFRGITYHMPTTSPQAGQVLKANDGSNNLVWGSVTVGNGSGGVISLNPEYSGASYFASGTVAVGTLVNAYDSTTKDNYYRWTSTKTALNDYWVAVRIRVPKNFVSWDTGSGITLKIRTHTTSTADNYVTLKLLDTNGNIVSAANGGASQVSGTADTWRTIGLSTLGGGTFASNGQITVLIKAVSKSTGWVDLGTLQTNWTTSAP